MVKMNVDDNSNSKSVADYLANNISSNRQSVYKYNIDFNAEYNFKGNIQEALKFYLNERDKTRMWEGEGSSLYAEQRTKAMSFILYPQALNPFLKIIESLKESDRFIITPAYNLDSSENNSPAYRLSWIEDNQYPVEIVTKSI